MSATDARDQALLKAMFAKMDPLALAAGVAAAGALSLFCATALLLINASAAGQPVGPHLALLGVYLPGYSVSWTGSILGVFYGALVGAGIGLLLAMFWNMTHRLYLLVIVVRRLFSLN